MRGVDDAVSLKLHPHPIGPSAGKNHVELDLRTAVCDEGMLVDQVYQVITGDEHVTPGCQILLEALARLHTKDHLGFHTHDGLRRLRDQLHLHVLRVFGRVIAWKRNGVRRCSGDDHRLRNQLRRGTVRVEIAEDSIHPRFRKGVVVMEIALRSKCGVVVQEDLQILAYDEHVEKLLVDDLEIRHRTILPRIVNRECQSRHLAHFRRPGRDRQIHMVFDRIRQTCNQGHPAACALTRAIRADVRVHRADVDLAVLNSSRIRRWALHPQRQDHEAE